MISRFHDLVVVFGAGKSGRAAKALLESEGRRVAVLDGDDPAPDWRGVDFAVASPGVALTHPWIVSARSAGVRVVSELQLGASRWKGRMLAVTGSKGKSSVVKLVAEALGGIPCGNYGTPLSELCLPGAPAAEWAVVEVSSFQMETTDDFHPEAAACLNLQEDHLDRHGSVEVYHGLKKKLLSMAKRVVEADCAFDPLLAGSYFDNPVLRKNGEIAAGLMRLAGLGDESIRAAFRAFKPLPHRMQPVGVFAGVEYIDDSKATSLAATCAGVEMALARKSGNGERGEGRLFLIAGGLGKGDSPEICIPCLQKGVEKVYNIGAVQEKFYAAWKGIVPCEMCGTLESAVRAAKRDAKPGDTVLLSPGCASFDQFTSYGARGDAFAVYARGES